MAQSSFITLGETAPLSLESNSCLVYTWSIGFLSKYCILWLILLCLIHPSSQINYYSYHMGFSADLRAL